MKMLVETFEQTETTVDGTEEANSVEAMAIIKKMGLTGQESLAVDTNERCPYREMNIEERNVYTILFPERTSINGYKYSYIPLRVLQIAAHAESMGLYKGLYVWSERVKPTDPILVGKIDDNTFHILARWGEALESWEVLRAKALVILRSSRLSKWQSNIKELEHQIANIDNTLESSLSERYFYV